MLIINDSLDHMFFSKWANCLRMNKSRETTNTNPRDELFHLGENKYYFYIMCISPLLYDLIIKNH